MKPCNWQELCKNRVVYIEYYGCTYNEGDAALLAEVLSSNGCIIITENSKIDEAEVIIIITCVVIDKTERKMLKRIKELSETERKVLVTGCLPSARGELLKDLPDILFFYPEEIQKAWEDVKTVPSSKVAVVQIGPGCMGHCTYCITRKARGRIKSRPTIEIFDQIRKSTALGAVEIRLTGQDLSAYGYDTGISLLSFLIDSINEIPGEFKVRAGMMNPATLLPDLENIAASISRGKFFRFIHLPVQSGSDTVLSAMNRRYTVEQVRRIISVLRRYMPDMTLAIDIICGFTGETDEDHRKTLDLIADIQPDMVNVTRFSYRPGTEISRKGEMPDRIRKERSREIIKFSYSQMLQKRTSLAKNLNDGNKPTFVIITEKIREGSVMGRTDTYQGVVINGDFEIGTIIPVKITGATTHYMTGILF